MKTFRLLVTLLYIGVWMSAIYLLFQDTGPSSSLVAILLMTPTLISIIVAVVGLPKIIARSNFPVEVSDKDIDSVYGSRKSWRWFGLVGLASEITSGVYMIHTGHGLAGCGEVLIASSIACRLLDWFDTSKPGRRLGRKLGIPITPNPDLDAPVKRRQLA